MNTYKLLSKLRIKQTYGTIPDYISSIHHDSREAEQNSLFVCIRGFTVDGHDYVEDAISQGASLILAEKKIDMDTSRAALVVVRDTCKALAILVNQFYDHPSKKLKMYGVTGTNGKTTVTTLMKHMLDSNGKKAALSGTIGLELKNEFEPSENTTSDVLTNQRMLHKAHRIGVEHMVMEVSSHGIQQGRLWGIDFDVATFTNLTQDHLDYHDTMQDYGNTKGLLFAQLGNDLSDDKCAVLNKDDPWFTYYHKNTPFEVISYALYQEADFRATDINYFPDRTAFKLISPEGDFAVETRLIGEFNVYNTLAAIASLFAQGDIPVVDLVQALEDVDAIQGRMQKLDLDIPISVYIDYAHTPDAIEKSISSVSPFKKNRLLFVAGTGGNRDETKRPAMAEKASAADYVILTINDPRHENAASILADMEKGMQHDSYALLGDRKQAIAHAIEVSEPDDIIIIAGKGQEDYQIIGGQKVPHSDMEAATEACLIKFNLKV